ncbi:hypothetical protein Smar_0070 [Staphylothermus marinus F1]|uniref:Phosphate-starvation-inducible E-like protein n=1 Tax=Staphylothermus marinus (strain ATCC 43588 / DSM 3639 / JCM 9404 / F1) TaxID=399550 RepID=A3DKM3_STAMF|nr:hypothetical protein [Staphylothermus marinus]ABN69183.1 hypothetical protein Smar_0070 [Staphylothermus marinus F1]
MSKRKKSVEALLWLGRGLILLVDYIIVIMMVILVFFAVLIIINDLLNTWNNWKTAGMEQVQIVANDVFFLIVFMEITRSVVVGRKQPEMYLVALAEVGFVVTIREIIAAVIMRSFYNLLLSSLSSLVIATVLLIIYRYVLPHRTPTERK